jgi:ribosomal protein S6
MDNVAQGTQATAAPPATAGTAPVAPVLPVLPVLPTVPPELLKVTNLYELFLIVDPTESQKGWDKVVEWVKAKITDRHQGFILKTEQWADSRKLMFEVKGLRRGTYVLVFFRAKPSVIAELERDFRLDEKAIRHMIIVHATEPDALTGRVRERIQDEFEDDDFRRRDDFSYDEDDDFDY